MKVHEYIVVGSGCTGAMAAQTLVEAGVSVTMLDVGVENKKYSSLFPDKDYLSIRKTEIEQSRYLLGDNAEGISWGDIKTGEHLTPARKHILKYVQEYLPIDSQTFFPMESLAYGGLGSSWGLGCCSFSQPELKAAGLDAISMREAYQKISDRIGISAKKDDASAYTIGDVKNFHEAPSMDRNNSLLLSKYNSKKDVFNKKGFYMGRPALALITQDKEDRKAYAYRDMDFYSDKDESAYRPWITINDLKKKNNFQYVGGHFVLSYEEKEEYIEVTCLEIETKTKKYFNCKKLILAPGSLGTARIVLRSNKETMIKLPLLCNPYSYIPCIQPALIGKGTEERKMGFAQLSLFHDQDNNNMDVAMASVYSYQSLMLFRIIKEVPLNYNDARIIMRHLMPGIVIMGLHHPEQRNESKWIELLKDDTSETGDKLKANYVLTLQENEKIKSRESKYVKAMRSLGAYALKKINPGIGSSIHYAGTLPFDKNGEKFTLQSNGKLNGTKNIFVADGSGFNYLPAKGLTFSLMANAHIVALNVLKNE